MKWIRSSIWAAAYWKSPGSAKQLLIVGVLVGLAAAFLYFAKAPRVYESTAQVLVVKKRPDTVTGLDTRNLAIEDYVATHQTLLRSPVIVERAIKKGNLWSLSCFTDETEDLTEVIIKALNVSRNKTAGPSNNVLNLSFRSTDGADCETVLNAVIGSYKDFLEETYKNTSQDTAQLITQAKNLLGKELKKLEQDYRDFREKAPLLFGRGKDGPTVRQERLSNIESKLSALMVRKAEVQGYLKAIDTGLQKGGSRESLLAMATEWAAKSDGDNSHLKQQLTMQNQLYPLLMEEQRLLETKGVSHPEVIAVRHRIDLARDFLASPSSPWRKNYSKGDEKRDFSFADPLELYRDYFKQQLNHVEVQEELLAGRLKQETDELREMVKYEMYDEAFRTDISRNDKLFEGMAKRLKDVDMIKEMGGYDASTIAPARVGKMVSPKAIIIFPIALVLGLIGGFGLAFLADRTDKSFRSIEEIRRRLGLPVVGEIPFLEQASGALLKDGPGGSFLDPTLCTVFTPNSVESESFRGVRTALYFSAHGKNHKVIQVTSPNGGDGKSVLASNLAVSIAQSGKSVLLIDADLRKPKIHKLFGLASTTGLGSIIAEGTEPKDAIQASGIAGLSVLPCGPLPPNPAELLTSPRFKELLDYFRDHFDFVLIDTPPLLAVTDPSVVAARVDSVLLVIRFTKNARPSGRRARQILASLGATVLGVVVNDTDKNTGSDRYGYGYGYGYGEYKAGETSSEALDFSTTLIRAKDDKDSGVTS